MSWIKLDWLWAHNHRIRLLKANIKNKNKEAREILWSKIIELDKWLRDYNDCYQYDITQVGIRYD